MFLPTAACAFRLAILLAAGALWPGTAGAAGEIQPAPLDGPLFLDRAIELDRGGGQQREQAILWYARAAARGEARAQYFLGTLWETGDGVPRVPAFAHAWYEAAAPSLPAAAEHLRVLAEAERGSGAHAPVAADMLLAEIVEGGDGRFIDLVWTSGPQPDGALFHVTVAGQGPLDPPLLETVLPRTALVAPLPDGAEPCCARVTVLDPAGRRYAASGWTPLHGGTARIEPPAAAEIALAAHGAAADAMLPDLLEDLAASGLRVAHDQAGTPPAASAILYHYAEDRPLAEALAQLVPGAVPVMMRPGGGTPPPGRITIRLVAEPTQ